MFIPGKNYGFSMFYDEYDPGISRVEWVRLHHNLLSLGYDRPPKANLNHARQLRHF